MSWYRQLRFLDLERFVNDRSTVAGDPRVDPEWMPEAGIARPLLWAGVPREEVDVFLDPGRAVDWHRHLETSDGRLLFPVHWWERNHWPDALLEEKGMGWVGSSFRTILLDPNGAGPLPGTVAARVMLKCHLETPIPGVKGNRELDRPRVDKCVRLSADLRGLIGEGRLAPSVGLFEKPLGLVHRGRGVLFRELPHADLVPGFSFWAERPGEEPIVVRWLRESCGAGGGAVEAWIELLARPLVEGLLSAMAYGYGLELHAQNTCFRLSGPGEPASFCYRDIEGIAYSGRIRRAREGRDPLVDAGNPELTKWERNIYRFFNRNYDQDLSTLMGRSLDALERYGLVAAAQRTGARRAVRRLYREAIGRYALRRWDPFRGLVPWSESPYGKRRLRRSHFYRRLYR